MKPSNGNACLNRAILILTRRDHSCTELSRKLNQKGFTAMEVESAIEDCRRLGYLDDARFAEIYVRQLERKGYGVNGIRHRLFAKGLAGDLVRTSLENSSNDTVQFNLCLKVLAKKMRHAADGKTFSDRRDKYYRFLIGRGFQSHIVRKALEEAALHHDQSWDAQT